MCWFVRLSHFLKQISRSFVHAKIQQRGNKETAAASVPQVQTTFCGVFLGAAFLIEQDGSDKDHHLHHNGNEGLQRCGERDDLQAAEAKECKGGKIMYFKHSFICNNIKVSFKTNIVK